MRAPMLILSNVISSNPSLLGKTPYAHFSNSIELSSSISHIGFTNFLKEGFLCL